MNTQNPARSIPAFEQATISRPQHPAGGARDERACCKPTLGHRVVALVTGRCSETGRRMSAVGL